MSMSTPLFTEEMRQQAIGLEGDPVTVEVEKGAIIKFAQAIGDDNPLFNDEVEARRSRYGGLIAPPTFLRSITSGRPAFPFDLPLNRFLDGGSDWEYFEPIRVGDRITSTSKITDLSERTGRLGVMVFSTTVITYRNQLDQVVATQANTSIRY
jgi:acyl dehydratase